MSTPNYPEPMPDDTTQRDAAPWWTSRRERMVMLLRILALGMVPLCVVVVFGTSPWVLLAACPFTVIVPNVIATRRCLRRRKAAKADAVGA